MRKIEDIYIFIKYNSFFNSIININIDKKLMILLIKI